MLDCNTKSAYYYVCPLYVEYYFWPHFSYHPPTKNEIWICMLLLRLWGRYFFHVDPGHWVPACVSISRFVTSTIADPETHAYSALVDFVTNSFHVTWAEQILVSAATCIPHVDYTINGCWSWTLCTIKSEIPSPAAVVTVCEAKVAIPENAKPGNIWYLLENTFLWK